MAEYMPASILIGGELAADRLGDLFEAATSDHVTNADDGGIGDPGDLEELIDGIRPLLLVHHDAPNGQLPALEAVCHKLGLTYCRQSDAKYEYEAEIVSWTRGMDEPRWTQGSQEGTAVISIDAVRELLEAPASPDAEVIARIRALLAQHVPVEVPPLVLVGAAEGLTEGEQRDPGRSP